MADRRSNITLEIMQPEGLLILARHLKNHLSRIRPGTPISATELQEAVEYCETLVQELESLSFETGAKKKPPKKDEPPQVG